MSGPLSTSTKTQLIGEGFRVKGKDAAFKWGVDMTDDIPYDQVQDYSYNLESFLNIVGGSDELKAYRSETQGIKKIDSQMTDGTTYDII
jgi:hypothetical protein